MVGCGFMGAMPRLVARMGLVWFLILSSVLPAHAGTAAGGCLLNNGIQHVIFVEFDNVHFSRDRAGVPSDLEQMPHLLNFLTDNGTLLTDNHTILISHTAGGILSSLTGVYPDRHGGTAASLPLPLTIATIAANFVFGALLNFGIGNYAPTLVMAPDIRMRPEKFWVMSRAFNSTCLSTSEAPF